MSEPHKIKKNISRIITETERERETFSLRGIKLHKIAYKNYMRIQKDASFFLFSPLLITTDNKNIK